jgi:hypothetical protein
MSYPKATAQNELCPSPSHWHQEKLDFKPKRDPMQHHYKWFLPENADRLTRGHNPQAIDQEFCK